MDTLVIGALLLIIVVGLNAGALLIAYLVGRAYDRGYALGLAEGASMRHSVRRAA